MALRGIRKSFGDLLVNDGVDLSLWAGQVHALLGENGAGKTTLMRILYGLTRPDAGQIEVHGTPVTITSPKDAIGHGIGMVTQHFALVRPMTVTENVVLSEVGLGPVDLQAARERVVAASERLGVRVDPDARVADLSIGEQQRVEILKALYHDCRVLVLDEPTAVLVPQDVEALFATIRRLTAEGLAVMFISHKLHEVSAISDQVSVLRRGKIVESVDVSKDAGIDARRLAELMVGRPTGAVRREPATDSAADGAVADPGETVLDVEGVTVAGVGRPALDAVTLRVRGGEILGVAGVSGNGQRELVDVLCGMATPVTGRVRVNDRDVTGANPRQVIAAGLGRITEDRHGSVVPELSVELTLVLEELERYRRGPFLDRRRIRANAEDLIARFAIKAQPADPIGSLSGGNMQKVLLARVLARDPAAVVVAQPTRGLDVGATEYVHRQLLELRGRGAAILLVSEDLEELLALSDRIAVLCAGAVVGELPVADATPRRLGLLMAGAAA
ncbi:MAG TPA: ABC transporter ATP-binding protein [Actinomycetes bacterium]|nr:ABC transporter ATP-binding protein [Actinomycetes bacterium]